MASDSQEKRLENIWNGKPSDSYEEKYEQDEAHEPECSHVC